MSLARSRRLTATLAALAPGVALALAPGSAAAAGCHNVNLRPTAHNLAAVRGATLCLVNQQRAHFGRRRLPVDGRLRRAAIRYSHQMVAGHFFEHVSPSGSTPVSRLSRVGFVSRRVAWRIGENIAWGTGALGTPRLIVRAWMHSPGHRANILNRRFTRIGVGVAPGNPSRYRGGGTYTTDFGARG